MMDYIVFNLGKNILRFWLEQNVLGNIVTLYVSQHDKPQDKYPIVSFSAQGECWRHPGLPTGWGFKLTKERKIKEIR